MNINEFAAQVAAKVSSIEGKRFDTTTVNKNGVERIGVCCRDDKISPTIYVEAAHEAYVNGMTTVDEVAERFAEVYRNNRMPGLDFDFLDRINDFEAVKDKIIVRLRSDKTELPSVDWVDPSYKITFAILVGIRGEETGSVAVNNQLLQEYGKTPEDLLDLAIANTERLMPLRVDNMRDMMARMLGVPVEMLPDEIEGPMTVISNEMQINGASAILYPSTMKRLEDEIGAKFWLMPSSIHEFLAVPYAAGLDATELSLMVAVVNGDGKYLRPEEILSNTVLLYDNGQLSPVEGGEALKSVV